MARASRRIGVVTGRSGRHQHVRAGAAAGEEQVAMLREGVVGKVPSRVGEHVREVPGAEVERPDAPVVDLHQVDSVVGGVGVVLPREEVDDIDLFAVFVERHGDGGKGAEPVELIEQLARALLELRGRRQARVHPQPRRAAPVRPGGQIVGEGDLGQRLPRQIEGDARPARVARGSEPFDRLPGAAAGESAQGE